jgi:hypothetical protein
MRYLLTQITGGSLPEGNPGGSVTKKVREQHPRVDQMCRVVEEFTGCKVRINPGTGYIDHESVGNGMEVFSSDEELKHFLFSAGSYIETGNDNRKAGRDICTDHGSEPYYLSHIAKPAADAVPVTLYAQNEGEQSYLTASGKTISEEGDPALFEQLRKEGIVARVDWATGGRFNRFEYDNVTYSTMAMLVHPDRGYRMKILYGVQASHKFTKQNDWVSSLTLTVLVPPELAAKLA